ncbi:MAG: hypothetical protein R6W83_10890 [Cryobacterium sp.]
MSGRDEIMSRAPSGRHPIEGLRPIEGLDLTELSPTEWRVTDIHRAEGDPSAVLGFIQNVGGAFEVTNLARLRERSYFSTFGRAAASLLPPHTTPTTVTEPRQVHA